jgi:bifunctional enzyme Fae/Hps
MSNRNYLQIAFNRDFNEFVNVIRYIPQNSNIIVEAGTPLIKKEGIGVIQKMKMYWPGEISECITRNFEDFCRNL